MRPFIYLLLIILLSLEVKSQGLKLEWANAAGAINSSGIAEYIEVDNLQNSYITGYFSGTVDFDPGIGVHNLSAGTSNDIFVQKLDSNGNLLWANNTGSIGADFGFALALDKSNNVYTTGSYDGTVDFDPGSGVYTLTTQSFYGVFIQKLDSAGNFVWARGVKSIGVNALETGYAIDVDDSNNVYVTGHFRDTLEFISGNDTNHLVSNGGYDIFVLKLDSMGNFKWVMSFGGGALNVNDIGYAVEIDHQNNIYVGGIFSDSMDVDPGPGTKILAPIGNENYFVVKFDSGGNHIWSFAVGPSINGGGYNGLHSLTIDKDDNVLITGSLSGTVDFDPGLGVFNLTAIGNYQPFVQKIDSLGNFIWAVTIDVSIAGWGDGIVTDSIGNSFVTGHFGGIMDADPDTSAYYLTANGSSDGFIIKLDTMGKFVWAKNIGGKSYDAGSGIDVDDLNRLYIVGGFSDTVDFNLTGDTMNLTSNGFRDMFVAKYSECTVSSSTDSVVACGSYQWIDGNIYTTSNDSAKHLLANYRGCDSIVSLNLILHQSYLFSQNISICQGDSVLLYGNYENSTGIYYDSLQTIKGCDSIYSTNLTVNPTYSVAQNQAICQGDSVLLGGVYQTSTGAYNDTLQSQLGCDSILITNLLVHTSPLVNIAPFNPDTLCISSPIILLPTASPAGGSYAGPGVQTTIFNPFAAGVGNHNVIYTYTDSNSCVKSDTAIVTVISCVGVNEIENNFGIIIYPNPSTGLFTIEKPSSLKDEVKVKLLDATSKLLFDKVIPVGEQKIEVDITNYSNGIYYLQLLVGEEVFLNQVLKN